MNRSLSDEELCWIHIRDVYTFLYLGANPHEQKVGQNIRVDLSIQIPYRNTQDLLSNTVDYGVIVERIQQFIEHTGKANLLEYLAEKVLDVIGLEYPGVKTAKLTLHKAYAPIPHFTGSVSIEAQRHYWPIVSKLD
jgi:dihydroneopterin aldolase